MPDALAAALVALAIAGAQAIATELRYRAARRERELLSERVKDVQHAQGIDRRRTDHPPGPGG